MTAAQAEKTVSPRRANPLKKAAPALVAALIIGADILVCVRNPQDLERLFINILLALSAYATLHARLLSLASAGFAAIGAYTSAIIAVKLGLPLFLSIPAAVLVCGLLALIIGIPVLKLNDVYLAICTLGFGEIVRVAIILLPNLTGGSTGANLSTGFPYEAMHKTSSLEIGIALAVIAYLFWASSRAKAGRALRAIRENPDAAATMGIGVVAYKNFAFIVSALLAGLAGAFYAHSVGSLDAGDFKFSRAVDILSYAVLGGSGAWFGPILGAGLLTALPLILRDSLAFLRDFSQLPNIINGLALVLVIIFMPGGLAELYGRGSSLAARRRGNSPPEAGKAELETAERSSHESNGDEAALSIRKLSRSFGGVQALSELSFDIKAGEVLGLIGPNGAGKTTLINMVSGIFPPSSGSIEWEGKVIQGKRPNKIARSGIARSYQNIQLFGEMTVLENVIVGHHARIHTNLVSAWLRLPSEKRAEKEARDEALSLLARLGLSQLADLPAAKLSYGDQRRVEIARALALRPRLLLLDEPAAGMNETETASLGDFVLDLKKHGYTILVVEHHMDLIMKVCDEIVVLNFGKKIAQGRPEEIARDEAVLEAYLGRE